MVSADVNREPEQYGEVDDSADAEMIPYLIDVLLLHRLEAYLEEQLVDDSLSDATVLGQWGLVGRAMLGQHPEANEDASGELQEGADDEDD